MKVSPEIRAYMASIGRKGGQGCSDVKLAALKVNAQKAGRPKGSKNRPKPAAK